MDIIWYRNPSKSEVIGRCGGDENNERPRRTDKSRTLKNPQNNEKTQKNYISGLLRMTDDGYCVLSLTIGANY